MAEGYEPKPNDRIVRAGTIATVVEHNAAIKHASIPSISGYSLEGFTFVLAQDGFISNTYSMFALNNVIYIRDPAQTFTDSVQFTFMYVAVYKKN